MFDWGQEPKKSCGDQFIESLNSTPYKINWSNKQFGKVWFETSLNMPIHYNGYCMIIMGVEGLIRGWKIDLSKFKLEGYLATEGYLLIEEGNIIVADLKKYMRENPMINDPRISEKDINKFVMLNKMFWEDPYSKQKKKEYLYDKQLEFLDE
jgi:hypothetical protein